MYKFLIKEDTIVVGFVISLNASLFWHFYILFRPYIN